MHDVVIKRISPNGLVRKDYGFQLCFPVLHYISYHEYHRDSIDELWGDEWELPIPYWDFLDLKELDDNDYGWEKYEEYRRTKNACCFNAKNGKPKQYGHFGTLKQLKPCPSDVAEAAVRQIQNTPIKVEYKP